MLTRQRTQIGNAIRAHLAELGLVAPIGRKGLASLLAIIADESDARLPAATRDCLSMLAAQLQLLNAQILENDRAIRETVHASEVARRLMAIPGVGPLLASAFVASCRTPRRSSRAAILPAGSASYRSRSPAAARSDWAASASRATATCDNCWSRDRSASSALPSDTAPDDPGSCS
jgi:transposase